MNKNIKILLFGILTWIIPFVVSFFFYTKEGKIVIDLMLFKSIMIVVGSLTGAFFLIKYFEKIKGNYLTEGIIVGISWLLINLVLDIFLLIPMSKMTYGAYFSEIGLRYLTIPITSITIGIVKKKD